MKVNGSSETTLSGIRTETEVVYKQSHHVNGSCSHRSMRRLLGEAKDIFLQLHPAQTLLHSPDCKPQPPRAPVSLRRRSHRGPTWDISTTCTPFPPTGGAIMRLPSPYLPGSGSGDDLWPKSPKGLPRTHSRN